MDILNYHFMVHVDICTLWRAYRLHAANVLLNFSITANSQGQCKLWQNLSYTLTDWQVRNCCYVGVKLKFNEEAIASAQVFYHNFYSVMDQDDYEATVSPLSALGSWATNYGRTNIIT